MMKLCELPLKSIANRSGACTQQGFTLVELMVTIAILAIVASIATPSYSEVQLSYKLRSYSNDILASAHMARSEAIKSNTTVLLCASADGTSCGGAWQDGWVILKGATVVQRLQAITDGYKITDSAGLTSLTFQPTGIGATQATLTICRASPSVGSQERVVTVSASGRPSVSKTTAGSCS